MEFLFYSHKREFWGRMTNDAYSKGKQYGYTLASIELRSVDTKISVQTDAKVDSCKRCGNKLSHVEPHSIGN